MNKTILATGSEDLNNAIVEYANEENKNYDFEQVYYREFLIDDCINYNTCIISELLPGEMEFEKLIYTLKSRDKRVILILLEENKEELEICIKYHITDVLIQPIKPIDVINIIEFPKTFKDIEFIYKKVGLDYNLKTNAETNNKKEDKKELKKSVANKPVKEIIKHTYFMVESKNIGIVSLSHGAGATFFTLNFAKAISEFTKTAIIEYPLIKPKIYNTIGIANYIENIDEFISIAHKIDENDTFKNTLFTKNNLVFAVTDPNKEEIVCWDENKMLRLLYISKMPINIVDMGTNVFDESIFNIIEQFNYILLIIDPYVPNILENMHMFKKIKKLDENKQINIKYVINKENNGVDKTELLNNLDISSVFYIPYIYPEHIYEAAHKNKIPYEAKEVREKLEKTFNKLIDELDILPEEITQKNKSIFKLFEKKKRRK